MTHRVIQGRLYRKVTLEAADVSAARTHISARTPTPRGVARQIHEEIQRLTVAHDAEKELVIRHA
jgi:hypothetical protein